MLRSWWRNPQSPTLLDEGKRLSNYSAAELRFSERFGFAEVFLLGVWIAFWTSVVNSARVTGRIFLRVSSRGASSLCSDFMGRVYHTKECPGRACGSTDFDNTHVTFGFLAPFPLE